MVLVQCRDHRCGSDSYGPAAPAQQQDSHIVRRILGAPDGGDQEQQAWERQSIGWSVLTDMLSFCRFYGDQ